MRDETATIGKGEVLVPIAEEERPILSVAFNLYNELHHWILLGFCQDETRYHRIPV